MNWKFKENLEEVDNGEFWYDITVGEYIKPEELLDDETQIIQLRIAIDLVKSFEDALDKQDFYGRLSISEYT